MTELAASVSIPAHVAASRVREINVYDFAVEDAEIQLAMRGFRKEQAAETFWSPHNGGHWVVTRAAMVDAVINDPDRFSNRYIGVPKALNPARLFRPLQLDPPEHVKYRMLIGEALSPRAVAILQKDARRLTIELIEGFRHRGECEFVTEFAQHMPIGIFLSIVGLPFEDRLELLAIAEKIGRPKVDAERMEGYADLDVYILQLISERRKRPGDDFVTHLCEARIDGAPLSEDELVGVINVVLIAGLDTVAGMLGFFARYLARNPDRRDELRGDPGLIPGAVEELMRRFANVNLAREVRCDLELDGVTMRAGDMVVAPLALYNLDEARFDDPLRVDFRRARKPTHFTFGGHAHHCLGALLARTELKIFLEEWLARIPDFDIRPGAELAARTRVTLTMPSLPLVWDPE